MTSKKVKVEKDKITSTQEAFFESKKRTVEEIADDAIKELSELLEGVQGDEAGQEMAVRVGLLARTISLSEDKAEVANAAYTLGQIVQGFRVLAQQANKDFEKAIKTTYPKELEAWQEFKPVVDELRKDNPLADIQWLMEEAAERLDISSRTAYRRKDFGGID